MIDKEIIYKSKIKPRKIILYNSFDECKKTDKETIISFKCNSCDIGLHWTKKIDDSGEKRMIQLLFDPCVCQNTKKSEEISTSEYLNKHHHVICNSKEQKND